MHSVKMMPSKNIFFLLGYLCFGKYITKNGSEVKYVFIFYFGSITINIETLEFRVPIFKRDTL
jgi:hypothetical protein